MEVILYYEPDGNEQRLLDISSPEKYKAGLIYLFNYFVSLGYYFEMNDMESVIASLDSLIQKLEPLDSEIKKINLDIETQSHQDIEVIIEALKSRRKRLVQLRPAAKLYKNGINGSERAIVEFMEGRFGHDTLQFEDYFERHLVEDPIDLLKKHFEGNVANPNLQLLKSSDNQSSNIH
ncbi:MAG: hypothetical protein KDD67_05315 [Ignavibacteriae bacterium]|nr:hypothetical protein [Ignavibacteriota bacterium]MCB9216255.1 hypothetical protein [Ignavibacteria bacterium]